MKRKLIMIVLSLAVLGTIGWIESAHKIIVLNEKNRSTKTVPLTT